MKRKFAGILALIFVFAMMAACGTTNKDATPTTSPSAAITDKLPEDDGKVTDDDGIIGDADDAVDDNVTTLPEKDNGTGTNGKDDGGILDPDVSTTVKP